MFTLPDGQLVLSATDLTNHLACPHLTQQKLSIARGERKKARKSESAHAELLSAKGTEHELAELARLSAECGGHEDLSRKWPTDAQGKRLRPSREWLEAGAAATEAAMRRGVPLIFQAEFFDGRWQGKTDFLRRVDGTPSELGDYAYAYEILDTKLSRQIKPSVVHQLEVYSRLLGLVQGVELPTAYVVLGNRETEAVALTKYAALHRRVVRRFEEVVAAPGIATYPDPVAHCPICQLSGECDKRLREDDHLSLVARARRGQRELLVEFGLPTVASLAGIAADVDSGALATAGGIALAPELTKHLGADRLDLLRRQAGLQVQSRDTGERTRHHLPPLRAAGYALLPDPSPGDIFFDLEGDPYVGHDGGIEYLWGWSEPGPASNGASPDYSANEHTAGRPAQSRYHHVWAHDEAEEKAALEAFVDHVERERLLHPGLHVFHYAPHERSKLQTLSVKYATREAQIDDWLRSGVLVDLYAVVAQALLVGEESYSLKKLERHHDFVRLETSVREGGGSIVAYEGYLETGDEDLLEAIRAYNEEDCRSTWSLREWLQNEMVPEVEAQTGLRIADLRTPEPEEVQPDPEWLPAVVDLAGRLHAGLPPLAADDDVDQAERRLAGHLLLYFRREQKPEWWRHFALREMPSVDLIDERDALGGLELDTSVEPVVVKSSLEYEFTFPPQDFKEPMQLIDPATGKGVTLARIDFGTCRATLRRSAKRADEPQPTALVPGMPIDATGLRTALVEFGEVLLSGKPQNAAAGKYAAVRALLRREAPRLTAAAELGDDTAQLMAAGLTLETSVLPIQGPPGTGKTFNAARMIVAALADDKRVGISAQSHAAIQNLLRAVEKHALEVGLPAERLAGAYKGDADAYTSASGLVVVTDDNKEIENGLLAGDLGLAAGTAWLFSRKAFRGGDEPLLELLFIDEAGQFALAQAVAVGLAAKSIVLLGDPQQLPQVTQADHPDGSGSSVLEHVINDRDTIADDRGVLLRTTWRMHPEICAFVSERSYDSELHAHGDCALRRVESATAEGWRGGLLYGTGPSVQIRVPRGLSAAGLRTIEVDHQGNSQSSSEEAQAIAEACQALLRDGTVTEPLRDAPAGSVADANGMVTRPLVPQDLLVVAPYNLAVQTIKSHVPEGVTVGTVDKIQGQEAAVVFYALTCSTGDDVPRGLDFLFDPNRFNVAVSRAQALAVLVHAPRLLDADCRTLDVMARVDGVCGLIERATETSGGQPS